MIKQLPGNKVAVSNEIPVSVRTESVSAYYEKLTDIFNNCIRIGTFPEILKKSEVTPVFKKGDLRQKQITTSWVQCVYPNGHSFFNLKTKNEKRITCAWPVVFKY